MTADTATPDDLSSLERRLLAALAESDGDQPPAELALRLEVDLGDVLDAIPDLQERGFVTREGFDTCRLTERGREALTAATD